MKPYAAGLMWFRRDLRAADNAAFSNALRACRQVHCVFAFDTAILDALPRADRRVEFIRDSLVQLDATLRELAGRAGAGLITCRGLAADEVPRLAVQLGVQAVFTNNDYEPAAMARDASVLGALARHGIAFHGYKDQVVFERREVLTQGGAPYSVFTPYKRAWLARLQADDLQPHGVDDAVATLADRPEGLRKAVPSLAELGFEPTNLHELRLPVGEAGARELVQDFLPRIDSYHETRDFPALKGPSYLSVHLRFGTVSIRQLAREAHARSFNGSHGAATWLAELVWRDFYFQVLANFKVADEQGRSHCFRREFEKVPWEKGRKANELFRAWCEGRTGYPLVDAAMAQINQTGYMHNRLRMVVASFLTKDLGVDWKRGERYFAEKLNDYDLAANNGGWQWSAGTGCDAQPWFRIFNPVAQSRKFDPEGKFIRRYLPHLAELPDEALHAPWLARPVDLAGAGVELGGNYPLPLVDHDEARLATKARYSI
ncbi:MAG: deoxyribodipyrimidine photo-lyase [Burkholderiales bacterium]|nr:deoxyribodipyrimidine photo-lyase [Burkholderiales bacterium]